MGEPNNNTYLPRADIGNIGGGLQMGSSQDPSSADYEAIFGPSGRDIKKDEQRSKRHQRWHLPDMLKGANPFLTDRVDGLITDATNSPFTTIILPYVYLPNPDAKIKWNVYSFDEGLATRVPYESGARVLTQSKTSHAGYAVRQGLAITMEHNFMMSPAGRENFNNQLLQLVGSIQYTNDLDVHMALITAPSYERTMAEKYQYMDKDPNQVIRQYVDMFGIMQKNANGLDIIIEESKQNLKKWGAKEPTFMLVNGKLCMQLNMNVERTQYMTNGYDGVKRLRAGPDMPKYRNLDVVNSRSFSLETGAPPRDLLNRRVRVAEYYHIPPRTATKLLQDGCHVELYDEARDQMRKIPMSHILKHAKLNDADWTPQSNSSFLPLMQGNLNVFKTSVKTLAFDNNQDKITPEDYIHSVVAYCNNAGPFGDDDFNSLAFWDYVLAALVAERVDAGCMGRVATREDSIREHVGHDFAGYQVFFETRNAVNQAFATLVHVNVFTPGHAATIRVAFDERHNMWNGLFALHPNAEYMMVHPVLTTTPSPWYVLSGIGVALRAHNRLGAADEARYLRVSADASRYRNMSCVVTNEDTFELVIDAVQRSTIPHGLYPEIGRYIAAAGKEKLYEILMVRPCIEHEMLGIVLGRGGTQELGCTFWGQTELSCYDDAFHGKWGMSYKYHERAIVHNEKNLIRLWDVCFNGYTGGMGTKLVKWDNSEDFKHKAHNISEPFGNTEDIMCMIFEHDNNDDEHTLESEMPNPIKFHGQAGNPANIDADNIYTLMTDEMNVLYGDKYADRFAQYRAVMPQFEELHRHRKNAGMASVESDTHTTSLAFMGTMQVHIPGENMMMFRGAGHLGDAYVGCASVRAGKGMQTVMPHAGMQLNRIV
jgi:hypothetical protein